MNSTIRIVSAFVILLALGIAIALSQVITANTATASSPSSSTSAPQVNCSLYASPSGSGSTCSSGSPCSLDTANGRVQAGNTLCLMPGTYLRSSTFYPHGGSASAYVTYAGSTGTATDVSIRQSSQGDIIDTNGANYINFQDFSVDGVDTNYYGGLVVNNNSHHVTVRNVYAHDTGETGIYAFHADYVTFDHNLVFHNGYNGYGWASGGESTSPW